MTNYYIDYTNGNDANDGLAANNDHSWKTLAKYTTTTTRTAGDVAYVRANTTEPLSASIAFDEDGTSVAYISVIGCDATTNDPWGDASNVLPVLDCQDGNRLINISGDEYWHLDRLNIKQSASTTANIQLYQAHGAYISNCTITDNSAATEQTGLRIAETSNFLIENCIIKDNLLYNISAVDCMGVISGCTFDGGTTTTDYGIYTFSAILQIKNCTFGSTTAHDLQDIRASLASQIKCINCTFNKTSLSILETKSRASIASEDDDGTFGNQIVYYSAGTVTKDATARSGGAASSAKLMPSSTCGIYYPMSISPFDDYDFKVWLAADVAKTITIYMRSVTTWSGTYPTAAQCYVTFSYLSNAASAARTTVTTNETFSDATTWVAFDSGLITPSRSGWVYIKVYLGKYTASNGIYVDIQPQIS